MQWNPFIYEANFVKILYQTNDPRFKISWQSILELFFKVS